MQFESAIKRNFILNILKGFIPDMILAGIISAVMKGGFMGFILALAGIELLPFPIWVVRSLFMWALYFLSTKRAMAEAFYKSLTLNEFPRPRETEESAESYFDRIANDEALPIKVRFAAAHEYWSFEYMRTLGQLQNLMIVTFAYEQAIQDYYKQAPSKINSSETNIAK